MGKPTGFKEFPREAVPYRDPVERADDYLEIYTEAPVEHLMTQGARLHGLRRAVLPVGHGLSDR